MQLNIIHEALAANSEITDAVSDRIFAVYVPENTQAPYIVLTMVDNQGEPTKDGAAVDRCMIEVRIWHERDNYAGLTDIASKCRMVLERLQDDASVIYYEREMDHYDEEQQLIGLIQDYKILIQK